jgi:hypothetical protein
MAGSLSNSTWDVEVRRGGLRRCRFPSSFHCELWRILANRLIHWCILPRTWSCVSFGLGVPAVKCALAPAKIARDCVLTRARGIRRARARARAHPDQRTPRAQSSRVRPGRIGCRSGRVDARRPRFRLARMQRRLPRFVRKTRADCIGTRARVFRPHIRRRVTR